MTTRQAIIWTNDCTVFWGMYASLGLNELIEITVLVTYELFGCDGGRVIKPASIYFTWAVQIAT